MHRNIIIFILLFIPLKLFAQQTEILYLSGRGPDKTVTWEFFCTDGRRAGEWSTIEVPSCWEQQGFGTYNYGHDTPPADEQGKYRYRFRVPASWQDKSVNIVFAGSMTDTDVKINGQSAGPIHQGAFYQFKYDITRLLNFGNENLLEVSVSKRSSNHSVNEAERQADYWVFGGIFRPVFLEAKPPEHIRRVAIDARADGDFMMDVFVAGLHNDMEVNAQIETLDGTVVGSPLAASIQAGHDHVRLASRVERPQQWTAETPNRYQVLVSLTHGGQLVHTVSETFGFRTIEVRPGKGFFVNGQLVKLKGVDRHSFRPETGRTLARRHSVEDVNLIKEMNLNAVRMSHYPPDAHFLDVCDSLGLYVADELTGWQDCYDTDVGSKLVRELVIRDVNHPCIVLWDNGNEGGSNIELDTVFTSYDPQKRTVIHPWANHNGINTVHYQHYEKYKALADGPDILLPTEIWHGLYDGGHAAGLDDYWQVIRKKPLGAGFFLWVFADEGLVRTDQNGKIDTDGNHAPDGIVGPHHEKEGSFFAIKEIVCPAHIEMRQLPAYFSGKIHVENDYDFTNLNQCRWTAWLADVQSLRSGLAGSTKISDVPVHCPAIPPHSAGMLSLDLPADFRQAHVLCLRAVDPFGHELYTWTFPLCKPADWIAGVVVTDGPPVSASEDQRTIQVTTGSLSLTFDRFYGRLRNVEVNGQSVSLRNGPVLVGGDTKNGRVEYSLKDGACEILSTRVSGNNEWHKWTIYGSGWIRLDYQYNQYGYVNELGMTFRYPEEKVKSKRWLGDGPYRVWKNRQRGVIFNVWQNNYNDTITGQVWDYPAFKGYFANMHWLQLDTDDGLITVLTTTTDLYMRILRPKNGADPRTTKVDFPRGDIGFLHGITPIGTKFRGPENTGPQGLPNHAHGTYRGTLYFYFGDLK